MGSGNCFKMLKVGLSLLGVAEVAKTLSSSVSPHASSFLMWQKGGF